jgi:CTP synthase
VYADDEISERHRHRYEVNNEYREVLAVEGMRFSGLSPDGGLVEIVELKDHPFFLATQFHPELKSRPNRVHPLFGAFVSAATDHREARAKDADARPDIEEGPVEWEPASLQ